MRHFICNAINKYIRSRVKQRETYLGHEHHTEAVCVLEALWNDVVKCVRLWLMECMQSACARDLFGSGILP